MGLLMSAMITGKEYLLSKIFGQDFVYYIPTYQRPYAWGKNEAEVLFDDLFDFYQTEKEENYFLGSIVLKKEENNPYSDVIDGQQRLTTLTILIAAISSKLSKGDQPSCHKYLCNQGDTLVGIPPQPRLHLREKDQPFFEKYIQNVQLDALLALDTQQLDTEAQQHIQINCEVFVEKLSTIFHNNPSDIKDFCTFILTRCYLVAVYTPSQQSAFRVFSVMNSRGLDLQTTDIVKADIIGKLPKNEQGYYTEKWEDLEVQTTRAGFNEVFMHTRMIFSKTKAKKNLLDEFREYVLKTVDAKSLIDDILEPYAETYTILKNNKYVSTHKSEEINEYLYWLNKIDNSDWMPVAIKFIAEHGNEPEYVLWFIQQLERLASYFHITAQGINARIDRYKLILEEMDAQPKHTFDSKLEYIELSDAEKEQFLMALDGEIYKMTGKRRNYILLRLDSFVSCGGKKSDYSPNVLTIEHVLPRKVAEGSEWETLWPDVQERDFWLNRIANLVPLTRRHNSEAQNYDFDRKKNTYFKGKNGTTSYPLTTQVIDVPQWTSEAVSTRQEELIAVFRDAWDLG